MYQVLRTPVYIFRYVSLISEQNHCSVFTHSKKGALLKVQRVLVFMEGQDIFVVFVIVVVGLGGSGDGVCVCSCVCVCVCMCLCVWHIVTLKSGVTSYS